MKSGNQLHGDATKFADQSSRHLCEALTAAWRAGQLLQAEKKRVRRAMGHDAWPLWLEQNFRGSPKTARHYLRIADSAPNESILNGLSIRQMYMRLGIPTEPKSRAQSARVPPLPAYLRLAGRLLVALQERNFRKLAPARRAAFRQDLRPIYAKIRVLFETIDGKDHS